MFRIFLAISLDLFIRWGQGSSPAYGGNRTPARFLPSSCPVFSGGGWAAPPAGYNPRPLNGDHLSVHLRELFCFIEGRKAKRTSIPQSEKRLSGETTETKSNTHPGQGEDMLFSGSRRGRGGRRENPWNPTSGRSWGVTVPSSPSPGSAAGAPGPVHGEPAPHREGRAEVSSQLLVLHACQPGEAAQHYVQVGGWGGLRGGGREGWQRRGAQGAQPDGSLCPWHLAHLAFTPAHADNKITIRAMITTGSIY